MCRILIFAIFFGVAGTVVQAAEDDENSRSGYELGDITVTATLRETSVMDAPAMVTVIGNRELEDSAEITVDGYLQTLPGVAAKRSYRAECGPGREVTLRGIPEQRRTLVLLDGVPLNDGFNGAVNWSLVPREYVERIEVVRGPMSAVYGSGAVGGVINIITTEPSVSGETFFRGSWGSLNAITTTARRSGRGDSHGYVFGGRWLHTDGYLKVKGAEDYHEKNDRDDLGLWGKYYYYPDADSSLTASLTSVLEDYSRGRVYDYQTNAQTVAALSYQRVGETMGLAGSLYGSYNFRDVAVGAPPLYLSREHREKDQIGRLGEIFNLNFAAGENNRITLGGDSSLSLFRKRNEYDSSTRSGRAEGKQLSASLLAQDEAVFTWGGRELIAVIGGRLDYCRGFDGSMYDDGSRMPVDQDYPARSWTSLNPRASLVYRPGEDTAVRFSAGRSFSAPTLSDLYMVFARGPLIFQGNPDLAPETAISYSAGFDQQISPGLMLRLEGYYTRGRDFIGNRLVAPLTYRADNVSRVEIRGVETELSWRVFPGLTAYGEFVWNKSTILEDDAVAENRGNYLNFIPIYKGRIGLIYDNPDLFTAGVNAYYVGKRYSDLENADPLDSYFSLDLYLARSLGRGVTVSLSGENLLDERYEVYSLPTDESYAPGLLVNAALTLDY